MDHGPYDEELTVFLPRSHPADEATSATLLDDAAWGMPSVEKDGGRGDLTALWHGTVPEPPGAPHTAGARPGRGVRRGGLVLAGAGLAAVLLLVRQQGGDPLSVTGVTVRPSSSAIGCDGVVTVSATIRTNGAGGTVSYRWRRSDGTVTSPVQQPIAPRTRLTEVTLLWAFHGPGSMKATAVLEVLSPESARAEGSFTYTCHT